MMFIPQCQMPTGSSLQPPQAITITPSRPQTLAPSKLRPPTCLRPSSLRRTGIVSAKNQHPAHSKNSMSEPVPFSNDGFGSTAPRIWSLKIDRSFHLQRVRDFTMFNPMLIAAFIVPPTSYARQRYALLCRFVR
ncbi:hypothetical protein FA13DRAFT_1059846 [Coprinellus micaceus]|uniref:Uncharacterized protein n=1 Tax=Coprinellus micaceus TaxID=71717 RepID=A0A4Y7RLG5_COPMI|nr:hypothetical protein FA13DRAFT_1059846 [Coprinellus micaceus]